MEVRTLLDGALDCHTPEFSFLPRACEPWEGLCQRSSSTEGIIFNTEAASEELRIKSRRFISF